MSLLSNDMNPSNILYLDCSSGISGDMTVAALLDLGADEQGLRDMLASLPLEGYRIEVSRVKKSGIDACDFNVVLDDEHENHDHDMEYLHGFTHEEVHEHVPEHAHEHEHEHHDHEHEHHHDHGHGHHHGRNLDDIRQILYSGAMTDRALSIALRIFEVVAEAESKVHGLPLDQVHFHEVGAVDSIVDIASIAYCIDDLRIDEVIIPSLTEGSGLVRCQHGLLPIPVPATSAIVSAYGLALRVLPIEGELVTPTGAATAAALRTSSTLPASFVIRKTGVGAGKREYAVASLLRAMLIESASSSLPGKAGDNAAEENDQDSILKLETNVDDCSGEALGFVMDRLFEAGARDVFYAPIYMKKNRPATLLTVLCDVGLREIMEEILFRHTTSIGIRYQKMQRTKLLREVRELSTPLGNAKVKFCSYQNEVYCYPEHESVAAIAQSSGLGYSEVYNILKTYAVTHAGE